MEEQNRRQFFGGRSIWERGALCNGDGMGRPGREELPCVVQGYGDQRRSRLAKFAPPKFDAGYAFQEAAREKQLPDRGGQAQAR